MLLAIDIGNSEVTLGVHHRGAWRAWWRLRTVPDATPDEYALWLRGLFRASGIPTDAVNRVALASVVPPLTDTFVKVIEVHFDAELLMVRPGIRTGIRILAENPSEVGSDLVVNAVAAYERFHGPCIVVSMGTATVFIAISSAGDFLGVAIAPGLRMAASVLTERTAQLPGVQLAVPPAAMGRNTVQSMQSGLVLGYASMLEGMVERFRREMGVNAPVIATGGLAGLIAPHTDVVEIVDPWLTLDGLRILSDKNQ